MAITGRLQADFASFYDAVTKAEVSLRSFEGNAGKVETSLNRMTDSFSGRKVITDATLMTEAIVRAGGASVLTASEIAQVTAKLGEAIEKSKALGIEAPAAMQKLHAETAKAAESAKVLPTHINAIAPANQSLLASLAPLARAFGVTFTATAIVGFGRELLNNADAMVKLSDKTGIAIEPLQQLQFAAEQSGNTFEQVASAISQMQNRLGSGDKGAVGALTTLGLSFKQLQDLAPDQQFVAIAREIAKVEDPMQRTRLAMELFGRAGAELLPTLISDITALGDAAPVMSEKATKALDAVGDSISHMASSVKAFSGEIVGNLVDGFSRWGQAATALAEGKFRDIPALMADVVTEGPKVKAAMDALIPSTNGVALSWEEMDRIGKELTETVQKKVTVSNELKRVQDGLFGRDLITRALQLSEALGSVANVTKLSKEKKEELQKATIAALDAYKRLGEEAPAALLKLAEATKKPAASMAELTAEINKLHAKELPPFTGLLTTVERRVFDLANTSDVLRTNLRFTAETIATEMSPAMDELKRKTEDATRATLSWSEAMELARTGQGAMGGTVGSRGGVAFTAEERTRMEQMFREGRYQGPIKNYTTDPWGKVVGGEIDWDRLNQMHGIAPSIRPTGSASAGMTVVNQITQPLGTPSAIAAAVNDAMTQWLRSSGMRLPSGA